MTLSQLEQFIKDNIQQPIKAAIVIDAVKKYLSAKNVAKLITEIMNEEEKLKKKQ